MILRRKLLAVIGNGGGEHKVRIVRLLRVGVMLQVVLPVGHGVEQHRVGAEPLAKLQVQASIPGDQAVRPLMHQDREAELAARDYRDGEDEGQWVRPIDEERHGTEDHGPGMKDQPNALGRRFGPDRLDLVGRQYVGCTHAATLA